jgi:DNA-directed RNA polymerase subunit RPC12/RpoP
MASSGDEDDQVPGVAVAGEAMTLYRRTFEFAQALTNGDLQAKQDLFWYGHSKAILDNVPHDFVIAIAEAHGFKAEIVVDSVVVISWKDKVETKSNNLIEPTDRCLTCGRMMVWTDSSTKVAVCPSCMYRELMHLREPNCDHEPLSPLRCGCRRCHKCGWVYGCFEGHRPRMEKP